MNSPSYSFGTDFHGNLKNIDTFLHASKDAGVDHVIFGGDMAPKKMAVRFTDEKAMPVIAINAMGDIYQADIESAQNVYEKGYMLFDATIDSEVLAHMRELFPRMREYMVGLQHDMPFTAEELNIIEQHLLPLMQTFLSQDVEGKKMFAEYLRGNQHMLRGNLSGPEQFLRSVLIDWKIKLMLHKRMDRPAKKNLLCGRSDASDADYHKKSNEGFSVACTSYSRLLQQAINGTKPWTKWLEIEQNLQIHAPEKQRRFMHDALRMIHSFRESAHATVSMILGNDDTLQLIPDLERAHQNGLIFHATNRVVRLSSDIDMLGYAATPAVENVHFADWFKTEEDIEKDLLTLARKFRNKVRYRIANIHCPPADTKLAKAIVRDEKNDYGSTAVRTFAQTIQPNLMLTGHIHRAWEVEGTVVDHIGNTTIFNPGDSEYNPRIVIGSLERPEEGYRIVT